MSQAKRSSETGAALLTVLLLVSVMAVIAATMLDRLAFASKLAGNNAIVVQARTYAYATETLATARIVDLLARDAAQTTLEGGWLGRDFPVPIDGGIATARLFDADNCFNINSLSNEAEGVLIPNPASLRQFVTLMTILGIDFNAATNIADSASDWIDSDQIPSASGAEDNHYQGLPQSYLPANGMMTDRSELRKVKGVTPELYARLKPWICALPVAQPTTLNGNTLFPEQAPLLAMLFEGRMSTSVAKDYLATRPKNGYGSVLKFWNAPKIAELKPSEQIQGQVKLTSNWFRLETRIALDAIELESFALIQADQGKARVILRNFGDET